MSERGADRMPGVSLLFSANGEGVAYPLGQGVPFVEDRVEEPTVHFSPRVVTIGARSRSPPFGSRLRSSRGSPARHLGLAAREAPREGPPRWQSPTESSRRRAGGPWAI